MKHPYRINYGKSIRVLSSEYIDVSGTVNEPRIWFRGIDVTHLMTKIELDEFRAIMCEERVGLIEDEEEAG